MVFLAGGVQYGLYAAERRLHFSNAVPAKTSSSGRNLCRNAVFASQPNRPRGDGETRIYPMVRLSSTMVQCNTCVSRWCGDLLRTSAELV